MSPELEAFLNERSLSLAGEQNPVAQDIMLRQIQATRELIDFLDSKLWDNEMLANVMIGVVADRMAQMTTLADVEVFFNGLLQKLQLGANLGNQLFGDRIDRRPPPPKIIVPGRGQR